MSSTLSTLKTRLSEVLKKSETKNLTDTQRERALNDALVFDLNNYRPWPFLIENSFIQAVSGVMNVPANFRKEYSLHYGTSPDTSWERYKFIDQTRFLDQIHNTATITEDSDVQVLSIYPTDDQGVDQSSQTADTDQPLFSTANNEQIYQTFTTDTTTFKGVMLKLKQVVAPTGTLTVSLYATSSSLPTGSALKTSTLAVADMTTSYEFFYFHLPYTTTADTEYAIVLSTSTAALDATNYVAWQYSTTSQISDGTRGTYNGTTYSTATGDMYFLTYNQVFNFQYSKKLTTMTASTSTTGVDVLFDEAIVMLGAARLMERQAGGKDQQKINLAHTLRYGTGGSQALPTQDSAYGKLNILWDELRIRTRRPLRKMTNVFERRSHLGSKYQNTHMDRSFLEIM